ncbi:alpha-1,3-mannosyl-glycoprotein 4-beta-N-acetylglucosaminyltransferase A isoform X2 [Lepeophtheirus salmonis]|uniref:alpha-1,3-mannosyl-glycoprotein 4-beta-N-acetylglucosaminyltransferase A isoform X2 n=1 Tax=Lepeophtheirus salmonis TaxID=72036 RepID=UPI001AE43B11|nr:alpha-1,3-mannosyl-glycoprotein 4-beta-N-acetylglucosaminyltransferase A-like isoform X2 [Lepeophtheirus salmonis]
MQFSKSSQRKGLDKGCRIRMILYFIILLLILTQVYTLQYILFRQYKENLFSQKSELSSSVIENVQDFFSTEDKFDRGVFETVIGISSVPREGHDYYLETLKSLLGDQKASNGEYLFVFMVSSFNQTLKARIKAMLEKHFKRDIQKGLLYVFSPNKDFYPLFTLENFDRNKESNYYKWRARQSLDYSYLFDFIYQRFSFKSYLHLEDDLLVTNSYLGKMKNFIDQVNNSTRKSNWSVMSFSKLGFIGHFTKRLLAIGY